MKFFWCLIFIFFCAVCAYPLKSYPTCCHGSGAGFFNRLLSAYDLVYPTCKKGGTSEFPVNSIQAFESLLKGQQLAKNILHPILTNQFMCENNVPSVYMLLGPSGTGKSLAATLVGEARHGIRCCCASSFWEAGLAGAQRTNCGISNGFRMIPYREWAAKSTDDRAKLLRQLKNGNPCPMIIIDDIMSIDDTKTLYELNNCWFSSYDYNGVDCHGFTFFLTAHVAADDKNNYYGKAEVGDITELIQVLNTTAQDKNFPTSLNEFLEKYPVAERFMTKWFDLKLGRLLTKRLVPFTTSSREEIDEVLLALFEAAACHAGPCRNVDYQPAFNALKKKHFPNGREAFMLLEATSSLSTNIQRLAQNCRDKDIIVEYCPTYDMVKARLHDENIICN